MRIRLQATRSPPCLDAGRRGFATIGSHRRENPHQTSGATVVRGTDPSGELQAATATGLIAPGVLCVFMARRISGAGAEKPRSGSSRSPASVIGHCQRRFLQGGPGRSSPDLAARTARGMPPEGPRSPRARQARGSSAGSPVAKRRARNIGIGKRPPLWKRRSVRLGRKPDRTRPASGRPWQNVEGQSLPSVMQFGQNQEHYRQDPGRL